MAEAESGPWLVTRTVNFTGSPSLGDRVVQRDGDVQIGVADGDLGRGQVVVDQRIGLIRGQDFGLVDDHGVPRARIHRGVDAQADVVALPQ